MKYNINSNSGISLVEMMIAFGMMSVLSLGVASLASNMQKGQSTMAGSMDFTTLRAIVHQVLARKDACSTSLKGQPLTGNPIQQNIQLMDHTGSSIFLSAGTNGVNPFRSSFSIEKLSLQEVVRYANDQFLGKIVIEAKRNQNAIGSPAMKSEFYLSFALDPTTKEITQCTGGEDLIETEKAVCASQSMDYDQNHWPRCYHKWVRDIQVHLTSNTSFIYSPWDGYSQVWTDLNEGAGGDWIYLVFTKYAEAGQGVTGPLPFDPPISDITVVGGTSAGTSCPAGYYRIWRDLNSNAGGDYIFFCHTRAERPDKKRVSEVTIVSGGAWGISCPAGFDKVGYDLNRNSAGSYIFLCQKRETYP